MKDEDTKPELKQRRQKGLKALADFKFTIYDVSPQSGEQCSVPDCRITPYRAWEELPYRERGGDGKRENYYIELL